MPNKDLEELLRNMVDTEFKKRDGILPNDIEINWSKLAVDGLLSSGVNVTQTTEFCYKDLIERLDFLCQKVILIIDSKNITYTDELKTKAKNLFDEFANDAKHKCEEVCSERVEKISQGSVSGSLKKLDHEYSIKHSECLSELEIYFEKLRHKTTFTIKGWLRRNATTIILMILSGLVGYFFRNIDPLF